MNGKEIMHEGETWHLFVGKRQEKRERKEYDYYTIIYYTFIHLFLLIIIYLCLIPSTEKKYNLSKKKFSLPNQERNKRMQARKWKMAKKMEKRQEKKKED